MNQKKIKTIVCGSTFGQFYLEALASLPGHFEIVGLLAQGSERSEKCAGHYKIPLFTNSGQLPGEIDLACVVLRSGVMGGKGTDLSLEFIRKGIHVIQEHPVHQDDIATCLREAQQHGVNFITGDLYIHLPAVKRFVACCRALFNEQKAAYIDIAMSTQVSFPLIHILLEALPAIRPFKINHVIRDNGPFQALTGQIGKIPLTIRAHNEVNPDDPDNHLHLLHSITVGFPGGCLELTDTHGPVIWRPRLHIPKNGMLGQMSDNDAAFLENPGSVILGPAMPPAYTDILSGQWVHAIAKDLGMMKDFIDKKNRVEKRAQQELLCARQWHELTKALGYPVLKPDAQYRPVDLNILYRQVGQIPPGPAECMPGTCRPAEKSVFDSPDAAEKELNNIKAEDIARYVQRIDKAAASSMLKALQHQGTLDDAGKEYSEQEILEGSKVTPKHRHIISKWLKMMTAQGTIQEKNGKYMAKTLIAQDEADEYWEKVKEVWDAGLGNTLSVQYLKNNADHLPDLMTDRVKAALLLFPEGKMDIADALYKDTITARYLNRAVSEAVMRIASEKYKNAGASKMPALKIVEIGAGTGATSEIVIPQLKADWEHKLEPDYLFSDVSAFFLGAAQMRFEKYPWVRFKVIDIDKDFEEQGLEPGSADIIIAAGVLNNAHDTDSVIAQFHRILAPGGYMLITEPVRESIEILISQAFMMTPPVDGRSDTATTFMSEEQWLDVFRSVQAEKIVSLPAGHHMLAPLGQRLFIVKKHGNAEM